MCGVLHVHVRKDAGTWLHTHSVYVCARVEPGSFFTVRVRVRV